MITVAYKESKRANSGQLIPSFGHLCVFGLNIKFGLRLRLPLGFGLRQVYDF